MAVREFIANLAAGGAIPVFAIAGSGMRAAVQDLRLSADVRLVDTPRAATILLVAGAIAEAHVEALARTHDLLPQPRATLAWGGPDPLAGLGGVAASLDLDGDPVRALRSLFRDVVTGRRPSEPPLLPDVDPVTWRGVGPYGQGGSGMTGGTPYGRPLAELRPDRDGLRLDVLPLALGPFFPRLPAGLVLDLTTSGDVVIEASVADASIGVAAAPASAGMRSLFATALVEPVAIAELEMARARAHLRWLADALIGQGLPALGLRALRLAHDVGPGEGQRVRGLVGRLRRTGVFRWSLPRTGRLDPTRLAGLGLGPVARSAGLDEDVRTEDPGYRALGFVPFVIDRGDATGRWQVRLEEAARALELAARAGSRTTTVLGRVESPRGRLLAGDSPTERLVSLIPDLLTGLEWGDAVATLISLDLDLDDAPASLVARPLRAIA
ncbi:MAG: hypothetical protein NVS9B8_03990 [Candidatus Limnocylindrales bacterium]